MGKRGQAALEFLMTYGWALLVVLIAIVALAFFGVLNPGKFLPSNCNLGVGFSCEDFIIDDDLDSVMSGDQKGIRIVIRNGLGNNLDTFLIYVDQNSNTCAGWEGYITAKQSPLYVVDNFNDGESDSIKTFDLTLPPPPDPEGIRCYNYPVSANINCCSKFSQVMGEAYGCGSSGINCATAPNSNVLMNKGSRFKADLIIIYRGIGSTLMHSRVGQISGKIE